MWGSLQSASLSCWRSWMNHRALVIGSQTEGLTGVDADAQGMATLLQGRGFAVDLRTGSQATRSGILAGCDDLIARVGPDDAAVVYYAGHGAIAMDTRSG